VTCKQVSFDALGDQLRRCPVRLQTLVAHPSCNPAGEIPESHLVDRQPHALTFQCLHPFRLLGIPVQLRSNDDQHQIRPELVYEFDDRLAAFAARFARRYSKLDYALFCEQRQVGTGRREGRPVERLRRHLALS
jgi:hypothetical protein